MKLEPVRVSSCKHFLIFSYFLTKVNSVSSESGNEVGYCFLYCNIVKENVLAPTIKISQSVYERKCP